LNINVGTLVEIYRYKTEYNLAFIMHMHYAGWSVERPV